MRSHKAFTMIELIFVIVIIGILAAVAVPKLSTTRDDAKDAKLKANIDTCLIDYIASYTATSVADISSRACTSNDTQGNVLDITVNGDTVTISGKLENNTDFNRTGIYKGKKVIVP